MLSNAYGKSLINLLKLALLIVSRNGPKVIHMFSTVDFNDIKHKAMREEH